MVSMLEESQHMLYAICMKRVIQTFYRQTNSKDPCSQYELVLLFRTFQSHMKTCVSHYSRALASYPGLPSQLFSQPWQKAWLRPGSKHHVMRAFAFVTTRVHGFICTRDVFHVVLSRDSSNTVFWSYSLQ